MPKEFMYKTIAEELKRQILQNAYSPGSKLPSELALAEKYNVSRITSRKSIDLLTEQNLVKRVQGSGTYVVDVLPDSPSNGTNKPLVSLLLPFDNENGTLIDFIHSVTESLNSRGFFVSIHNSEWDFEKEHKLLKNIFTSNIDGMIFFPISSRKNLDVICEMVAAKAPFVVVDSCYANLPVHCVSSNNLEGTRQITNHILEKGHRNIAFFSYEYLDFNTTIRDRYLGFCKAHSDMNLKVNERINVIGFRDNVLNEQPQFKIKLSSGVSNRTYKNELIKCLKRMIQLKVTAIVAEHDALAIDIMMVAEEIGIRIPEDISVVGFDDIPLVSRMHIPLTTVKQDFNAMGIMASNLLVDFIRTRKIASPNIQLVDTHPVFRDSIIER